MVVDYETIFAKIDETKDGCDKNCKDCVVWMPHEEMCWHELDKKYKAWQKKRSQEISELLRSTK